MHTHGHLVEVLLVESSTDLTDGESTTHYIVTAGRIGETCNVTEIGGSYNFERDTVRCWCVNFNEKHAQADALDKAFTLAHEEAKKIDSL